MLICIIASFSIAEEGKRQPSPELCTLIDACNCIFSFFLDKEPQQAEDSGREKASLLAGRVLMVKCCLYLR